MPIGLLGVVWGAPYLMQVHHLSHTQTAVITTMIFLGTIIGAPVIGNFSDKIRQRRKPMLLGATFSLLTVLVLIALPSPTFSQLLLLFLLLGFFTRAQVISYPLVAESNPPFLTATAVSVVSLITQGGIAVFEPLFGRMLQSQWNGLMIDKIPVYSAGNYHRAMLMLPIAFFIALLVSWFIKETHARHSASS